MQKTEKTGVHHRTSKVLINQREILNSADHLRLVKVFTFIEKTAYNIQQKREETSLLVLNNFKTFEFHNEYGDNIKYVIEREGLGILASTDFLWTQSRFDSLISGR